MNVSIVQVQEKGLAHTVLDKVRLLVRYVEVRAVQAVTTTEIMFARNAEVLESKYVKDVGVLEKNDNRDEYVKISMKFESVFYEQNYKKA